MPGIEYPDIFFTPEYQELFKDTAFGGEPCHFSSAGIDYRFYKRPIPNTPYFDIVSPYGYSGPFDISGKGYSQWVAFDISFWNYCKNENIIAEFARLHPFIEQITDGITHYEHDIYYIDLTKSEDEIWKGFDKGCRSAAKTKEEIGWCSGGILKREFAEIYNRRMVAKNSKEYVFDSAFFNKLANTPGVNLFMSDDLTAGAVFLSHGDYCHYFLSASLGKPMNHIIWEAIKYAKTVLKCKIFNLGGGLKAGDSLESFKRSFTHDSKPFDTYRKVHNQAVYNELSKGIETNYFPAYRAERRS